MVIGSGSVVEKNRPGNVIGGIDLLGTKPRTKDLEIPKSHLGVSRST